MPFGTWAPDQPALLSDQATLAQNVIPARNSYLPVPAPVEQSPALNGRVFESRSGKDSGGNAFNYAATQDRLYQVDPSTAADKSGMPYTTSDRGYWDSTSFGDRIIFTNYVNPVQAIQAGAAGNFTDLFTSADKPAARWCATARNFLMIGNTNDTTDGPVPNRLRWSAINNPADMDPDSATQSDYEDIQTGGAIQRIVGGKDYAVVFQENAISRVSYTGDATIWRIDPIDERRGTPLPKSVIGHGRTSFYISEEGFFAFTGTESIPIGEELVDTTFWNQFNPQNAHRMSATMTFDRKLAGWLFPGSGSTGGNPNKLFVYNWTERKWAEIFLDLENLTQSLTDGFTLEELNSVSASIDDLPYSLDDPIWQGGRLRLGAYTQMHKLAYFNGANLEAYVDTNDFQLFGGRRGFVDFLRPLIDGAVDVFLSVAGRDRLSDKFNAQAMYGPEVKMNAEGLCPVDKNARYHRVRARVPAGQDWTHMQGVRVYGESQGSF